MPAPNKWSIMISRFPGGSIMPIDMPDTTDYFAQIMLELKGRQGVFAGCDRIESARISDTPITMSRNKVVNLALAKEVDFLLMLDNDMKPDMYVGQDQFAEPFLPTTLEFILKRWDEGPHIVGAPYCGPPPLENIYVFQWTTWETDHPNPDYGLQQFSREEAARKIGFERVAALPTGLCLFDMRVFRSILKPPYFYYEWKDATEADKASTEDVTMTRDAGLAGAKLWCAWSSWAGHYKLKCVGRPRLIYSEDVGKQFKKALENDHRKSDRIVVLGPGGGNHIPSPLKQLVEEQHGEVQSDGSGRDDGNDAPSIEVEERQVATDCD